MGKPFEIVYSPEQYDVQTNATQAIAWGGVNTMQPENVIAARYTPAANDVVLRNAEIRSRNQFDTLAQAGPDAHFILGLIPGFNPGNLGGNLIAATDTGVYGLVSFGGAWTKLTGSGSEFASFIPISWRIFQKILYMTQASVTSSWDGVNAASYNPSAISVGGHSLGARYLTELDNHLILLNVSQAGVGSFPQRVWWSANNLPTVFDPTVNVNAGFEDLLDVSDQLTGESVFGRVGYAFRTNGITEFAPTGVGISPFSFDHLMSSQVGIGNQILYGMGQYGNTAAFIANDNIYSLTPSALTPIGENARDAIFEDLSLSIGSVTGPPVIGSITPWLQNAPTSAGNLNTTNGTWPYLLYMIFCPHSDGTSVWWYSFAEKNWMNHQLPGVWVTSKPCLCPVPTGVAGPVLIIPTFPIGGGTSKLCFFNPFLNNDPAQGSSYSFRQEDIEPNRVPTVNRVILQYRDIGVCTLTVTVTGMNDNGAVVTASKVVTIGTGGTPFTIKTIFVDLTLTGFRPQLTISRAANGGPFSIIKAVMVGESEEVTFG